MTEASTPGRPARRGAAGPVALVLASIISVQFGGALAATLIPRVGALGTVALRLGLSALIVLAAVRPSPRGHTRRDWATVAAFGAALALMNSTFYGALAHLPIGVAVTVEFIGPLVLSASLSRRRADALAVLAAAVGVVLISQIATTPLADVSVVGLVLALVAGGCWAAYILLSGRTGACFDGADGIAWALLVGAVLVVPLGLLTAGSALAAPDVLLPGVGIAVLSSALPYSLELLALRHLDARVFGVLLSLEPAAAAAAGLLVLHQALTPTQTLGMGLVVCASAAVTIGGRAPVD